MTGFTVHRSIARVVTIAGRSYRLIAEDFATVAECEEAASACVLMLPRIELRAHNFNADQVLGALLPRLEEHYGTMARAAVGTDDSRPYGNNIVLEPIAPSGEIHHIDGNPHNNELPNLKLVR